MFVLRANLAGASCFLSLHMAAGDLINYANCKAMDGSSWRHSTSLSGRNWSRRYYISAPAWHVTFTIKGSGLWGYQEGSFNVYAYNSSTGKFDKKVYGSSQSLRGGSKSYNWNFSHNYNGGSSGDIHDLHLWCVDIYAGNNDGSTSGNIYTGGIGVFPESIYNSHFKGKTIYASKGDYWQKGNTYASDEAFLAGEGPSHMKGTKISVVDGTYKYISTRGW